MRAYREGATTLELFAEHLPWWARRRAMQLVWDSNIGDCVVYEYMKPREYVFEAPGSEKGRVGLSSYWLARGDSSSWAEGLRRALKVRGLVPLSLSPPVACERMAPLGRELFIMKGCHFIPISPIVFRAETPRCSSDGSAKHNPR